MHINSSACRVVVVRSVRCCALCIHLYARISHHLSLSRKLDSQANDFELTLLTAICCATTNKVWCTSFHEVRTILANVYVEVRCNALIYCKKKKTCKWKKWVTKWMKYTANANIHVARPFCLPWWEQNAAEAAAGVRFIRHTPFSLCLFF